MTNNSPMLASQRRRSRRSQMRAALVIVVTMLPIWSCGPGNGAGEIDAGADAAPTSSSATDTGSTGDSGSTGDTAPTDTDTADGGIPTDTQETCDPSSPSSTSDGLIWRDDCRGLGLLLKPTARIDGIWLDPATGSCVPKGESVQCTYADAGVATATWNAGTLVGEWRAQKGVELEALGFEGSLTLPESSAWLSNGFQSWSQSGVISIPDRAEEPALWNAVRATGEAEVYRRGKTHSWWYSYVGGGETSFFAGATTASRFSSWLQIAASSDETLFVRLMSGGRETISCASGDIVQTEIWQIALGQELTTAQEKYGRSLETRRDAVAQPAPCGWNSWYDLWDDVRESDIVSASAERNAALALEVLGDLVPQANKPLTIVVDDGWQKSWGDWQPNNKFPSGIDGLASELDGMGLKTGLWLAPLLVAPGSDVAKAHPAWLVKGASYQHPTHGTMRVLDVTHPEAATHLDSLISEIVGWGVNLLKIDFLFAGSFQGTRNENVTGIEAYHRALSIIREAAGEEVILLAVGAPPLPSFPYVDGWRSGNDIAFKPIPIVGLPQPTWSFIANQARQFTSRWPLCLATLCDADPPLLRQLTRAEVEAGVWVAVATGGALFLSDDLTKLAEERRSWGIDSARAAIGLGAVPATPESWFPSEIPDLLKNMKDDNNLFNAVHHVPSVWRMPDGTRVGFNFTDSKQIVESVEIPRHSALVLP